MDKREYDRNYYHTKVDKAKKNELQKQRRKALSGWVREYLSSHPCVDCGEADPVVLEFDHIKGTKLGNVSDLTKWGWSVKRIQEEMDKCEVRCANCHRRITWKRRNRV